MPACPSTVTSCGVPSRSARCSALISKPSSWVPVDQRRRAGLPGRMVAAHRRDGQPDLGRRRAPAQGDRGLRGALDRRLGQRIRGATDQHAAGRRERLQPGRGVDHVTGDDRLPAVAGGGHVDDRLAGRHSDPEAQAAGRVGVAGQHPLQLQPGPDAAHRVGLGRDRGAEECHDGVADVLLDHSAVLADDLPSGREEVVLQPRTSSGSARSTYGVKSMRSTKRTLMRRRSVVGATSARSIGPRLAAAGAEHRVGRQRSATVDTGDRQLRATARTKPVAVICGPAAARAKVRNVEPPPVVASVSSHVSHPPGQVYGNGHRTPTCTG